MASIESPLGKKTFNEPGRKVFTVPDEEFSESDNTSFLPQTPGTRLSPSQFQEFQDKRNQLKNAQKKSNSELKTRIEILTGIGRLSKEVEIEENGSRYKYTLQSLKAKETREIVKIVSQITIPSEVMYEMRVQTLARSLVKINDQPLELMLSTNSIDEVVEFLNNCEEHLVNQLYSTYSEMVKTHEEKVKVETEQEAQALVEEIKK